MKNTNTFYTGDALKIIKSLLSKSVNCCVTSPPYWGLRDYEVDGQIGLEKTPEEYVNNLVDVFREVRRVLREDGTLWLNLGDSYASGGRGGGGSFTDERRAWKSNSEAKGWRSASSGLKNKDLVGIPWMVAFALRADGWYLRSDIIWEKPNAMPSSVKDRPTVSHEYIFLLSKNSMYYYDADAIREPHANVSKERINRKHHAEGHKWENAPGNQTIANDLTKALHPNGRNKRTIWTIPTKPFKGAHFAVFPPNLIKPCILAGTSPKTCPTCGEPWRRLIGKTGHVNKREICHTLNNTQTKTDSTGWAPTTIATNEFIPSCRCKNNDGSGRALVLDCFGGSGTTNLVAEELGRDSIYIDLSSQYTKMAKKRGLPSTDH